MSKNPFNPQLKENPNFVGPKRSERRECPRVNGSFEGLLEGPQTKQKITRNDILKALGAFGKLPSNLIEKMQIPNEMHEISKNSFSSIKSTCGPLITCHEDLHSFYARTAPEYSLVIGERGSTVLCTLVDKKRGILVSASIKNATLSQGNWEVFERRLDSVLFEAKNLTPQDLEYGRLIMSAS